MGVVRWEILAGILSLAAAVVHGGLTPAHFAEWWGYGVFFAVAATCQALLGLALLVRATDDPAVQRKIVFLGLFGQLALIGFYIVTRTIGIPLGPSAGQTEGIAVVDLVTLVLEIVCALALASRLSSTLSPPPSEAA